VQYKAKIKPLLIGTRRLSRFNTFASLDAGYRNLLRSRDVAQTEKAMCYFGNSYGLGKSDSVTRPDYNWERDNMAYFGDKVHHPNEKRAKIADMLSEFGKGYDARIIKRGASDSGKELRNEALAIPLTEFSHHVAKF